MYYKRFGSPAIIFGAFLSLFERPCPVQTVTHAILVDFCRSKTAESDQLDMPFLRVCFYRLSHYVTVRTCLHEGGGPQVGEVKYGGSPHLSCKRDQINMRDYMDKRVTPPTLVTSPTWGPPPPCKPALNRDVSTASVLEFFIRRWPASIY